MSTKIYNHETGRWEVQHSNLASGVRVIDAEGRFESNNVEGCLNELATSTDKLKEDVQYIYENGTLGGGGGGGGASKPQVKLDSPSNMVVTTDTEIEIYYYFTSPNVGSGTANLSINNVTTTQNIKQGKNKWSVGTLPKGVHLLDIFVVDSAGLFSNSISVEVTSGALEITSDFDDREEFSPEDDVSIDYTITSVSPDDVSVDLTLNGETQTVRGIIGKNTWHIGRFNSLGVHKASIKAYTQNVESNTLEYNIVLADSEHLYVSSSFNQETIEYGRNLNIDYRISMKGETKFKVYYYINDQLRDTVVKGRGEHFWNVGNNLDIGSYRLKIIAKTYDEQYESNELIIPIEVTAEDFVPFKPVTRGLIASFDANGKQNDSVTTRNTWEDLSGNNVQCTLHNFNYKSNGWIDNTLKFNGKTYATVDLRPLANNIPKGFTLDIMCKINNVGDLEATVLECKNNETPYQGFSIDTTKSTMRSFGSKIVESEYQEDQWVRQTYVVDREQRLMILYVNGVLSGVAYLDANENFTLNKPITLGARTDNKGNILSYSSSSIKTLRIYDTALTSEEVLQNHIADIKDIEEQKAIRELNFGDDTIPVMRLEGSVEGMTNEVHKLLKITYVDPKDPSKNFIKEGCQVYWQGTSSLKYPVKNYTIKLRDGGNDWLDYSPKDDWLPESRYTLKANFMESSHSNNIGTAKFVHESLFKENPYPCQIKNPKTRMSVEGFPIKLFINGEDQGIYTFNMDRYAHNNYGLLGEPNAVSYEVSVNSEGGAGAFADTSWESIRNEFEYRYHYAGGEDVVTERLGENITVLKKGYHQYLEDLVRWVNETPEEQFESEIHEHFSLPHLIDYYLGVYLLGLVDSLGKNMVLTTWGANSEGHVIWYPSFYDADTMFGLTNDGQLVYPPSIDMQFGDYNTSNSVLWTKLRNRFSVQIADRYKQLRENEFSYDNLISYYQGFIESIGQRYYNEDAYLKYIKNDRTYYYLCNGDRLEFTKRWLEERLIYMDSVFEYGPFYQNSAIVRSNVRGEVSLRIQTYSPQWIEVKFSDENTNRFKKFVDKDKTYEFKGTLLNPKDNNIEITGAGNIMRIDGIEDLNVSGLLLGNAKKLVEINVGKENGQNTHLNQLILGENYLLQRVNAKNCINLGNEDRFKVVDVSRCVNLRYFNASNTQLGQVVFNEEGGALEELDLSNTKVTELRLRGQEYLPTISLDNCRDLTTLDLNSCNALTRLTIPNSKLSTFSVVDCDKVEYIDISNTGYLSRLDLSGCPNLTTLKMSGLSNSRMTEVDLTYSPNINYLDISKCDFLELVKFAEGCNTLKHLNASDSGLKYFKYGRNEVPNYLDLGGFNLTYVNFYNCTQVEEIRNINLVGSNMAPFYNCRNLRKIRGSVRLSGSLNNGFRNCEKLTEFPSTFDLSGVTSLSEGFLGCKSITLEQLQMLLGKLTNVTDLYHAFTDCDNIVGEIPRGLFDNNPKITNLYWTFVGTTNLHGQLPTGIFDKLTNLTTFRNPFNGRLTGFIPPNLFKYNTKLESLYEGFINCKFTVAPDKTLFSASNYPNLTSVESLFRGCSDMVGMIDKDLLKNCRNLVLAQNLFNGCSSLSGTIDNSFLQNNTRLTTVRGMFSGCSNLSGELPTRLLQNNYQVTDVGYLFSGCANISGNITTSMFSNQANLQNMDYTFNGCTNLGGVPGQLQEVPVDLFWNKRNLKNISGLFKGCSQLQFNLYKDMFRDCTSLTHISELFSGCIGLTGDIPEGLFTCYNEEGEEQPTVIEDAKAVFYNCRHLSGSIPSDLFQKFLLVKDLSNFFANCFGLYGEIPTGLLNYCYSLIYANRMFYRCYKLGKDRVTQDDPYFMDENMFMRCTNLEEANEIFNMSDGSSKLKGQIPDDLFRYNTKLKTLNHSFYACGGLTGGLNTALFKHNKKLVNLGGTFRGCSGLTSIESDFISGTNHPNVTELTYTFSGCSKMTGNAPRLWETHSGANSRAKCFEGCTSLSNYSEIPLGWK